MGAGGRRSELGPAVLSWGPAAGGGMQGPALGAGNRVARGWELGARALPDAWHAIGAAGRRSDPRLAGADGWHAGLAGPDGWHRPAVPAGWHGAPAPVRRAAFGPGGWHADRSRVPVLNLYYQSRKIQPATGRSFQY